MDSPTRPLLPSELSDVNGFVPCTDQTEINSFINEIVPYMQAHPQIYAYAYSNGLGLGDVWPLMNGNSLRSVCVCIWCEQEPNILLLSFPHTSESGKTYLNAIRRYHWPLARVLQDQRKWILNFRWSIQIPATKVSIATVYSLVQDDWFGCQLDC